MADNTTVEVTTDPTSARGLAKTMGVVSEELIQGLEKAWGEWKGVPNAIYKGGDFDLRFPSTLGSEDNNTPIIMFIAKEWDSKTIGVKTKSESVRAVQKGCASLYLPSFSESTSIVWDDTMMAQTAATNWGMEQIGAFLPARKFLKDQYKIQNGVSISQDTIATFQDVENRVYTFSFELIPLSKDDASNIEGIIHFFRINSTPNFGEAFISAPCIFDVKILGVKNKYFVLLPMALTALNVSYGDSNGQAMQLMSDDTPSFVKLELTFREVRKPYRDFVTKNS